MTLEINNLTKAYIDGEWVAAKSAALFDVKNPATGEILARVADCGEEEASSAIAAASRAFPQWASLPVAERASLLRKVGDLMIENLDVLAKILTLENGKPIAEARGEIQYGASYFHWFAEEAKRIYGDIVPASSPHTRMLIRHTPIGVCAVITPWNFPNAMIARKIAAALAAGCTIVGKPAEDTPLSALAIGRLAEMAGIPSGVVNIVPTQKAAIVGGVFTSSPDVKKISFTGSTPVGRRLYEQSAPTLKRLSMELGGNAPFIVFEDADLHAAADGLMLAKFRNAGQTCVCANRIFVHADIIEAFTTKLCERAQKLTIGPGLNTDSTIGPLINQAAISKVSHLVDSAKTAGAQVVVGGGLHPCGPLFFQPTVLTGVSTDMAVANEEIFGPILPIISFETEKDVLEEANRSEYGLAAYFYTKDVGRTWRVAEALEYGMIGTNTGAISHASAPFGGVKQSGFGREGSKYGLDDYLDIKCQHIGLI